MYIQVIQRFLKVRELAYLMKMILVLAFSAIIILLPVTVSAFSSSILNEDFNDGVANNFVNNGGTWSVSGGAYKQTATGVQAVSIYSNGTLWTDYAFSADVKPLTGSYAGILFRSNAAMTNFYVVRFNGTTKVEFGKVSNGVWSLASTYNYNSVTGKYYNMRVYANGNNFKIYINNSLIATINDTSFHSGSAGVYNSNSTADFDNILTISPHTTTLFENFNDDVADNFSVKTGTWSVSGGVYNQSTVTDRSLSCYANGTAWTNYEVSADVKAQATTVGNGIVFRCNAAMDGFYVFRFYNNMADVGKLQAGIFTTLATYTYSYTAGTYYNLRVEANGSSFKFYINNVLLGTITDTTYTSGSIGLYTYLGPGSFDNLIVSSVNGTNSTAASQTLQAETFTTINGGFFASTSANYTGTGYAAGLDIVGDYLKIPVSIPNSGGHYDIAIRYTQNTGSNKVHSLYINGVRNRQLTYASTGSWSTWNTLNAADVILKNGINEIMFKLDAGENGPVDIDRIIITENAAYKWDNIPSSLPRGAKHGVIYSPSMNRDIGFNIYYPPEYYSHPDQSFPVIYEFHGLGGNESTDLLSGTKLHEAITLRGLPAMIMVWVNVRNNSFYCDSYDNTVKADTMLINELIPHIDTNNRSIASREGRAIQAMSMGGCGGFKMLFKYSNIFKVLNVYGAAVRTSSQFIRDRAPIYAEIFNNNSTYYNQNDYYALLAQNASILKDNVKIRMSVGSADYVNINDGGWNNYMDAQLNSYGIAHTFRKEIPGIAHDFVAYLNNDGDAGLQFISNNVAHSTTSGTVIIDNDQGVPDYRTNGTWSTSTGTGYNGGSYQFVSAGSANSATWITNLISAGTYKVSVIFRSGTNRATSVKYNISTATGTQTSYVNQTQNNLVWVTLGTWNFNAGTATVTLDAAGSSGGTSPVVIADAVQFEKTTTTPPIVTVDNDTGAPGYTETGAWTTSGGSGYNGGTYRYTSVGTGKTGVWNLNLPSAGNWKISVIYKAGTNRATSAKYIVTTASGTQTANVNQTINDLTWITLGTWSFNTGGGLITLDAGGSTPTGTVVIADAVKAEPQ